MAQPKDESKGESKGFASQGESKPFEAPSESPIDCLQGDSQSTSKGFDSPCEALPFDSPFNSPGWWLAKTSQRDSTMISVDHRGATLTQNLENQRFFQHLFGLQTISRLPIKKRAPLFKVWIRISPKTQELGYEGFFPALNKNCQIKITKNVINFLTTFTSFEKMVVLHDHFWKTQKSAKRAPGYSSKNKQDAVRRNARGRRRGKER